MKVWVTRDEPGEGPLCTALRAAGLTPVLEPVVTRRCLGDARAELETLGADDWLVLTSAFTVRCLALDAARVPRVAAVGEATAAAARDAGLPVEVIGRRGAATLLAQLRDRDDVRRLCHPRSAQAQPPAPWPGVTITSPIVYETVPRSFDARVVDRVEIVAVTSPSTVAALGQVALSLASIGPTTSDAVRRHGLTLAVEAPEPTFEALARAIAEASPGLAPPSPR